MKVSKKLQMALQNIKLLILDVDGVLTDGSIYLLEDGSEYKSFHAHDGVGIKSLIEHGIEVAVISGRFSKAVEYRLRPLGVEYIYQKQNDKNIPFIELKAKTGRKDMEIAYIGDDLPDLPIMRQVGVCVAVANAHISVRQEAHIVTTLSGGKGAVREFCDLLLATKRRGATPCTAKR